MQLRPASFLRIAGVLLAALATTLPAHAGQARIAIAMFGPHPSLQQVVDGFKEGLAANGVKATFDEGNVNFDRSLAPQLLTRQAAANPDLMLTVTTPMTQSARQVLATRQFPIVFAPVTDPVAAKLVPAWDRGDTQMIGVSNLPDFDGTLDFIKTLVPGAKRLGILYNPGDDSDTAFVTRLEQSVGKHGMSLAKVGVDNANDIGPRVQSMQGQVDALFIPASSLLQPASAAIASVANRIKLPVFNSNTTQVAKHEFLAAYSVDWYRIGVNAGEMAAQVLDGAKPADMSVSRPKPQDHQIRISAQRLAALGLSMPDAFKDCKDCLVP